MNCYNVLQLNLHGYGTVNNKNTIWCDDIYVVDSVVYMGSVNNSNNIWRILMCVYVDVCSVQHQ